MVQPTLQISLEHLRLEVLQLNGGKLLIRNLVWFLTSSKLYDLQASTKRPLAMSHKMTSGVLKRDKTNHAINSLHEPKVPSDKQKLAIASALVTDLALTPSIQSKLALSLFLFVGGCVTSGLSALSVAGSAPDSKY